MAHRVLIPSVLLVLTLFATGSLAVKISVENAKKEEETKHNPCGKNYVYPCTAPCGNGTSLGCCSDDYQCCPLSACGLTEAPSAATAPDVRRDGLWDVRKQNNLR